MARLKRLAQPTQAFNQENLPTVRVTRQHTWLQLYRKNQDPVFFGRTGDNRFDSSDQSFGVCYLARHINGSFVEVFCRDKLRRLTEIRLKQYHVAEMTTSRSLKLVDLAGKGLVRLRLDARLTTGNYKTAQLWSRAFHNHPDQADGILYRSRHDPKQQLVALFDRSQSLLSAKLCGALSAYMGNEFYPLLDHYDIALL